MEQLLLYSGQSLQDAFPHIPNDTGMPMVSSLTPFWYLSPTQHVKELLFVNLGLLPVILLLMRAAPWRVILPAAASSVAHGGKHDTANVPAAASRSLALLRGAAHVGKVVSVLTIISTVVYKASTDRMIYLLQPCHIMNAMLVYLSFATPGSLAGAVVFNFYLHACFGAWLALLQPDTRDLLMPGECASFFAQHLTLTLLPMVFIALRRFDLYEPRAFVCWGWKLLYHIDVLLPLSLYVGANLNYVVVPPPGPLIAFGSYYRQAMSAGSLVMMMAVRYAIVEGMLAVGRRARLPGFEPVLAPHAKIA